MDNNCKTMAKGGGPQSGPSTETEMTFLELNQPPTFAKNLLSNRREPAEGDD